jgi:hypothetical protein
LLPDHVLSDTVLPDHVVLPGALPDLWLAMRDLLDSAAQPDAKHVLHPLQHV